MKRASWAALLLGLAACGRREEPPTAPSGPAVLAGTVLDAATRLGLGEATVQVVDGPDAGRSVRSGGDGRFRLEGLQPVEVTVRATHASGEAATATVALRFANDDLQLLLRPRPCATPGCGAANACNRVLPFFARPFDGDFRVSNHFDHAFPRSFSDGEPDIQSYCGMRGSYNGHEGYDWVMPVGTLLKAVAPGMVTFAGTSGSFFCPLLGRDTANPVVEVEHAGPTGERFRVRYLHVSAMHVQTGQAVGAGDVIAASGNLGCSTGPHLHFDVRRQFAANSTTQFVFMDPFGWQGAGEDPWSRHQAGAFSVWIWAQAPSVRAEWSGPPIVGYHPGAAGPPQFR